MNLSRLQCRVVALGWVTYASFYFGRVNIASALPAIESEFGWTSEQTGLLVGAMLWTYALGQLVHGWLGQRLNARKLVMVGLVGSSVINVLMASIAGRDALPFMIMVWLINGIFQSMGW